MSEYQELKRSAGEKPLTQREFKQCAHELGVILKSVRMNVLPAWTPMETVVSTALQLCDDNMRGPLEKAIEAHRSLVGLESTLSETATKLQRLRSDSDHTAFVTIVALVNIYCDAYFSATSWKSCSRRWMRCRRPSMHYWRSKLRRR